MRLFVAIDVGAEVREKIAGVRQALVDTKADVRWVEPGNFHVTVKFIGEVEDGLVGRIAERVTVAAVQVPVFPLEVEGLGRFPEKGQARVIISRVVSPDQRLTKLHRLVDSTLGGIGVAMDTRVLMPHLTLGRVNSNHGLNRLLRLLEKHDLDFFGGFEVERVVLYESTLGAGRGSGPVYRVIHAAGLAGGSGGVGEGG